MSKDKNELLAWAYTVLKQHIDNATFGIISVHMANGVISNIKVDQNYKAPTN